MSFFRLFFLVLAISVIFGAAWEPPTVLEPDHPRILFTSDDSAAIAESITSAPFSSYYSSIWSTANGTSGNGSDSESMYRSRIAMNAAFVLYFGVQPGGAALTETQRTTLTDKVTTYLSEVRNGDITSVSNTTYHYSCEALIQFAVAYDLMEGAGIDVPESGVRNLADDVYDSATYWLFSYLADDIALFANHKLIVCGALGTAAVAMPENGEDWINYAMTKMNYVMFTEESSPTSVTGFAEGPHYFKYALEHMMMWFVGMKHYIGDTDDFYTDPCGGDENATVPCPWYDERIDRMYYWISELRLPNGTIPTLDDGFRHESFCLTAPFAERDSNWYWQTGIGASRINVYPAMMAAQQLPVGEHAPGLTSMPDAGNLIFRGTEDYGNLYFHYLGEHGVANSDIHDQADAASFILHAFDEDLAIDPGYIHYDERSRVNGVDKHNTILVNGGGQSVSSPVESYITNSLYLPAHGESVNQFCYGKVSTNYSSTDITRHSAMLGDMFIVLVDDLSRSSSATYTFQCHGEGLQSDGTFISSSNGGVWAEADPVRMRCIVDAVGGLGSLNYETSAHEVSYNNYANHTVIRAEKTASNTKFTSVLFPFYGAGPDLHYSVPSIANQSTIRFGANGKEGIVMACTDVYDWHYDGDSSLPEIGGYGEGCIALFDSATGNRDIIYLLNSQILDIDDSPFFTTVDYMDIAFSWDSDNTLYGKVNGTGGYMIITLGYEPTSVLGAESWEYVSGEVRMTIPDDGLFIIDLLPLEIEERNIVPENMGIIAYPNPFNSSCTIEFENLPDYFDLISIDGKVVMRKSNLTGTVNLDLSNLESGVYLIKTSDGYTKNIYIMK